MIKVTSKEKYNTSFGVAYIVPENEKIKIGEVVSVDEIPHKIKKIIIQPRVESENRIAIFV